MNELLRSLPSVERLLATPEIEALEAGFAHDSVVALVREKLGQVRTEILSGSARPDDAAIVDRIVGAASSTFASLSFEMICSVVCRFLAMILALS